MPGGAELLSRLLSASAPEQTNPSFGLHETTPQMLLDHLNQSTGMNYSNINEANDDGRNIPATSIYHDSSGKQVTDPEIISKAQDIGSYGTTRPMKNPGFWQRFANPQGAANETAINTQFATNPAFAQQANDTRLGIARQNIGKMPNSLKPAWLTDDQMPYAGYTGTDDPVSLASKNRAAGDLQRGITGTQVGTDIASANRMLTGANREVQRAGVEESTLDANAVNQLHTATGVDPKRIELAHQQLIHELGREPKQEEIRELLLKEQKNRALVGNAISDTQVANISTLQNTEQQGIRNSAYEATHPPVAGSPFYRGATGVPTLNPSYIGQMQQLNAKLGTGTQVGGSGHVPLGNGLNIIGTPPATEAPMIARPLRVAPVSLAAPSTNAPVALPPQTVAPTAQGRPVLTRRIDDKDATAMDRELWPGGPSLKELMSKYMMPMGGAR